MPSLPKEFEILHMSNTGRVYTLIVKGDSKDAKEVLKAANPMLIDVLPLTLEEIFIYEMGGMNYEKSETSCFNKTIFKKNITRFWPIWALYLAILFFQHAGQSVFAHPLQ